MCNWNNALLNTSNHRSLAVFGERHRGGGDANQYSNTIPIIGKYQNTMSKIDEIPIPHLRSVMLSLSCIHLACLIISDQACTSRRNQPQPLQESVS